MEAKSFCVKVQRSTGCWREELVAAGEFKLTNGFIKVRNYSRNESVRTRCALWFSGGKTSTSRLLRPSERTVSAIDHAIIVILLITRSYWKRKSINFSTWFYQLWSWQRGLQISRTPPPGPRNSIHLPVLYLSAGARWRSAARKNRKCWNVTISASSSPAGTLKTVFRLLMPTSEQTANHVDVMGDSRINAAMLCLCRRRNFRENISSRQWKQNGHLIIVSY